MKRILFLLSFIMLSLASFSQDSSLKSSPVTISGERLPDSAKLTFSRVYSDVKSGISGLASALKVGAEHVYSVLIKQQLVKSVTNLVRYAILLIIMQICWTNFSKNYRRLSDENDAWYRDDIDDHTGTLLPLIAGIFISIVFLLFLGVYLTDTITGFVNPEYGAIQDIINFVKQ